MKSAPRSCNNGISNGKLNGVIIATCAPQRFKGLGPGISSKLVISRGMVYIF